MMFVLSSLGILAAGAVASIVLRRRSVFSLDVSMAAVFAASVLAALAGVRVLTGIAANGEAEFVWPLPLGTARLVVDGLSAWFLLAIGLVTSCVAVYSAAYMRTLALRAPIPAYGTLLCALVAFLFLVVTAADVVLFLAAWEGVMLAAFFLISFHDKRPEVRNGAWTYVIANHLGTALCVIPLFGMLVAQARTTAFSAFPAALAGLDSATLSVLFGLGLLGFGTKAGFFPLHIWLPAAHPVAPSPISAVLSGVVVKIGIYGLFRTISWMPALPSACGLALMGIGVTSGVLGVLYALAQHDLKRLLAYHTVENIGIIAVGMGIGMLGQSANDPVVALLGYSGALLHVTNHAVFKGLLFLSAGAALQASGTTEFERLGGLARKTPVNAAMFLIGAIAICGLPPLNGFLSEWIIYGALFAGTMRGLGASGGAPAFAIFSLALMGGLALACFAKVYGVVFLGQPRDPEVVYRRTPAAMKFAMMVLAAMCILIGLAPGVWVPLVYPPAAAVLQSPASSFPASMETVLANASTLWLPGVVLLMLAAALTLFRRNILGYTAPRDTPVPKKTAQAPSTWGCGYSRPAARMQYTAASFAAALIGSFRVLLWPERELVAPAGAFPAPSHVESHVLDFAEHDVFAPLFRGLSRFFGMIRSVSWSGSGSRAQQSHGALRPLTILLSGFTGALRRGSIHICILFIIAAVVILFLFEGLAPRSANGPAATGLPAQSGIDP